MPQMAVMDYRLWGVYDNSVDVHVYYDILLWQRFSFHFVGRHQLLFSLGDPLDSSYMASAMHQCIQ